MDGTDNSSLFKYRAIPFLKREEMVNFVCSYFSHFSDHMLLMLALPFVYSKDLLLR